MIDDNLKWESIVKHKISRAIERLKYAKHYVKEGGYSKEYVHLFNHIPVIVTLPGGLAGEQN